MTEYQQLVRDSNGMPPVIRADYLEDHGFDLEADWLRLGEQPGKVTVAGAINEAGAAANDLLAIRKRGMFFLGFFVEAIGKASGGSLWRNPSGMAAESGYGIGTARGFGGIEGSCICSFPPEHAFLSATRRG